jgi:hypothetical protein
MKTLYFLIILANMFNSGSLEEDVWVDYVMGKPYMPYFEAKQEVAKAWGINYEVKFVGCKVTDQMEREQIAQSLANEKYFAKLTQKHGKDWQERFEIDVKKKLPFAQEITNPVWEDAILGRPHMGYIDARKAVAKKWGINYKPLFLGCVIDKPGVKESREKANKKNKAYLQAIEDHYGKDWKQYFNAEVEAYVNGQ